MFAISFDDRSRLAGVPARSAPRFRWLVTAAAMAGVVAGCAAGDPIPRGGAATDPGGDHRAAPAPSALTAEVLYKLLTGEFASHRGDRSRAVENYLEVARATGDAAVARRAVQLAASMRDYPRALEAVRLWRVGDPASLQAREAQVSLLTLAGQIDEAVEQLAALMQALPDAPVDRFGHVARILAGVQDRDAAVTVMQRLITHDDGPDDDIEAQFVLARMLVVSGRFEEASAALDHAFKLDPDNTRIAIFRAHTRQRLQDYEGALEVLMEFLERWPDAHAVRISYARLLIDTERYQQAQDAFARLVVDAPEDESIRYTYGRLLMEMNQIDAASWQFEQLVHSDARRDGAHYHLAQIAAFQQRPEDAIALYQRVHSGEYWLPAQINIATLLANRGDIAPARRHLHGLRAANAHDAVRIYQAEAALLTRAERHDEAMAVYDAALAVFPGNTELLYARGILGEKMGRLDIIERDLRDILSREPGNADVLNALGYTLADRTDRYEEAYTLIKRALELEPDSYYIVDSMGWILYRMGRYREALTQLQRAMSIRPDPEVAAHLGAVLWALGEMIEARKVWDAALEVTPDNRHLLDVIKRFGL